MHQFGNGVDAGPSVGGSTGGSWAVATPHRAATQAAVDAFEQGGNAIDAALAAAAMLTVVYPNQCSVGGDLIALVATPDGEAYVVNSTGRAPRSHDLHASLGTAAVMPVTGPLPVTVPGTIAGWAELARRWGSKPLAAALGGAEAAAREGIAVAPGLARDLAREQERLAHDDGTRALFFRGGRVLAAGDLLWQPNLGASLAAIADGGPDAVYDGELGASIVQTLRDLGSTLTMDDFRAHTVNTESPLSTLFADVEYLTSGGNSQGTFFLQGLRALELISSGHESLDPLGAGAGLIARILAVVGSERDRLLADPSVAAMPIQWLLSEEHVADIVTSARSANAPGLGRQATAARGDTVAVVATDAAGNWVSLIQSVFHAFGSGILDPRTGILLHNRGASFSLNPSAANRLVPGARPPHTLMPVLVRQSERVIGAHGAMGGRAQAQIHTHVALHLRAGSSLDDAVSAPRWVVGALEAGVDVGIANVVKAETGVASAARNSFAASGLELELLPENDDGVGHAQLVRREKAGSLAAACDPRADGEARSG